MNTSITIGTMYDCDIFTYRIRSKITNPTWRHNMIGCYIINLIVRMYNFNVSYVRDMTSTVKRNHTIDLFALPMPMTPEVLEKAIPVHTVLLWRLGFILGRAHDVRLYLRYYSKPFDRPAWNCMYGIAFIVALLFYLCSRWEKKIKETNWECSFGIETLLVIGGYCQHIFPVEAISDSRRIAYFTFFLYSYIIYAFYTSNLLSHLVNDKENGVKLEDLYSSDYDIVALDTMIDVFSGKCNTVFTTQLYVSNMPSKLKTPKFVSMADALEAVQYTKTAIFSDFNSIYPSLQRRFDNEQICRLGEIDLSSEVRLYMMSSKNFTYRELFVIGTLRIRESGLLQRYTAFDSRKPLHCDRTLVVGVEISQILAPVIVLCVFYVIATAILFIERWHYKRNMLWPYVE